MAYCNLDKAIYDGVGKYDIPPTDAFSGNLDVTHWIGFNCAKQESILCAEPPHGLQVARTFLPKAF